MPWHLSIPRVRIGRADPVGSRANNSTGHANNPCWPDPPIAEAAPSLRVAAPGVRRQGLRPGLRVEVEGTSFDLLTPCWQPSSRSTSHGSTASSPVPSCMEASLSGSSSHTSSEQAHHRGQNRLSKQVSERSLRRPSEPNSPGLPDALPVPAQARVARSRSAPEQFAIPRVPPPSFYSPRGVSADGRTNGGSAATPGEAARQAAAMGELVARLPAATQRAGASARARRTASTHNNQPHHLQLRQHLHAGIGAVTSTLAQLQGQAPGSDAGLVMMQDLCREWAGIERLFVAAWPMLPPPVADTADAEDDAQLLLGCWQQVLAATFPASSPPSSSYLGQASLSLFANAAGKPQGWRVRADGGVPLLFPPPGLLAHLASGGACMPELTSRLALFRNELAACAQALAKDDAQRLRRGKLTASACQALAAQTHEPAYLFA